jgi:DNA topoisomerase-2
MNTPILKAFKGNQEVVFYNEGEYETWKEENDMKGWKTKYYKGLGTSTGKEFREYFEKKKIIGFEWKGSSSKEAIDMVFNKKRADDRKDWLETYDRNDHLATNEDLVSYDDFIGRELIHFSKYDCDRSIPNLMDGHKTSQRKIFFSALKKGLTNEIKVAQFSGYVSEHSGYHHGEASLNGAIVGMAQNFVGSNNINLFMPNGQFGTRLQGGKDSASERYIFTQLSNISRFIFRDSDDHILKYLDDDGLSVEPIYYAPIIPMVLVNGCNGIGTGFSTDIMCYNPLEIIAYLKAKLQETYEQASFDFVPYYDGFKGQTIKVDNHKYLFKGCYSKIGPDKIQVTELPVGFWTDDFKEHLESLAETTDKDGKKIIPVIKDYDDMSKDTTVDFTITLTKGKLEELESKVNDNGCNELEKVFKLFNSGSLKNMHLFDADEQLKKYDSVNAIIDDYYLKRLSMYQVRKDYLVKALSAELLLLSNKTKYIKENLEGTIDLRRKKKDEVVSMLSGKGYDIMDDDEDYKYLTKMPMDSVTEENVIKLEKEHGKKEFELKRIQEMTIQEMWLTELDELVEQYTKFKKEKEELINGKGKTTIKKVKKVNKLNIL